MNDRTEQDLLGEKLIPGSALYGIHTARALENFPLAGRPCHPYLIQALGSVKLAAATVHAQSGIWKDGIKRDAILAACAQAAHGTLSAHIPVDALQGGAGTSLNMNVNEVIANRALQIMGLPPGTYHTVSPSDDINLHQSTNDTVPTALKLAAIRLLRELEREIVALQEAFQIKEKEFASVVKIGRTEMQDAVLTTLGRTMGAFAEALNRDRWRIYKCEERLRVVNFGGTAIGTGLGAPRSYIFKVTDVLREQTGIGFARAENLVDATQNADVYVEVSGMLKACATSLLKICGDLRFLSSGPHGGIGEILLPPRQTGSSIMPGKVNPVIPEAVSQCAMKVMGLDLIITHAAASGNCELNPFIPVIADALLESLTLLRNGCTVLRTFCIDGITAHKDNCRKSVDSSTAVLTALIATIGYDRASIIALESAKTNTPVRQLIIDRKILSPEAFDQLTSAEAVCRLGSPQETP